jgi:RNA polymerase sigma factor (sigma-70 family)
MPEVKPRQLSEAREALRVRTANLIEEYGSLGAIPKEVLEPYYVVKETRKGRTVTPKDDDAIVLALSQDFRRTQFSQILSTPQQASQEGQAAGENREAIANAIGTYLGLGTANQSLQVMREHQAEGISAVYGFLSGGERYGYVSHPAGSGKTHIIAELVDIIDRYSEKDMKIVVLSPTQLVLEQNVDTINSAMQSGSSGTYYGVSKKNLESRVINTTYQSFISMLVKGVIDPSEIGLVVLDEGHMALGEQRHRIMRAVPDAVAVLLTATAYFQQLHGYEQRGLIDSDEPWRGLFEKRIHNVTQEELIVKGVLTPLISYVVKTDNLVGDISITNGNYNEREIERYLNTMARNYMAVAMIAGPQAVPHNIRFSRDQLEHIEQIHEKIAGKRTAVFGISIDHVEKLAQMLREAGVTAETIHGKIKPDKRKLILDGYNAGNPQVVLGVDVIRQGWDSPVTEVGIILAPTQSGIVAVQRVGRVMRPSPETGKTHGIMIEVTDRYSSMRSLPILVSDTFDQSYLLRGSMTGKEVKKVITRGGREVPIVEFRGMNIDSIFEEARSSDMVRGGFKGATIDEMNDAIEGFAREIRRANPQMTSLQFYTAIAQVLPERVSSEANGVALSALASIDTNVSRKGYSAVIMLNMKTIFTATRGFMGKNESENEEILDAAIVKVADELLSLRSGRFSIGQEVYRAAFRGAADYIASREGVSTPYVLKGGLELEQDFAAGFREFGFGSRNLEWVSDEVSSALEINDKMVYGRLISRFGLPVPNAYQIGIHVEDQEMAKKLQAALSDNLYEREKEIVRLRYALGGGEVRTLEEVGEHFNLTRERIRSLIAKSLSQMRQPESAAMLREFTDRIPEESYPPTPLQSRFKASFAEAKSYLRPGGYTPIADRIRSARVIIGIRNSARWTGTSPSIINGLNQQATSLIMQPTLDRLEDIRQDIAVNYPRYNSGATIEPMDERYRKEFEGLVGLMSTTYDTAEALGVWNVGDYYVTKVLKKLDSMAQEHFVGSNARIYLYGMASEIARAFEFHYDADELKNKALDEVGRKLRRD